MKKSLWIKLAAAVVITVLASVTMGQGANSSVTQTGGFSGRFQLYSAEISAGKPEDRTAMLFKIDIQTGKTWFLMLGTGAWVELKN